MADSNYTDTPTSSGMAYPPPCMVRYHCPTCSTQRILNAYNGPPVCEVKGPLEDEQVGRGLKVHRVFMEGIGIVRDKPHPYAVDPRGQRASN